MRYGLWDLHHLTGLVKAAKNLVPSNVKNTGEVVHQSFLLVVYHCMACFKHRNYKPTLRFYHSIF